MSSAQTAFKQSLSLTRWHWREFFSRILLWKGRNLGLTAFSRIIARHRRALRLHRKGAPRGLPELQQTELFTPWENNKSIRFLTLPKYRTQCRVHRYSRLQLQFFKKVCTIQCNIVLLYCSNIQTFMEAWYNQAWNKKFYNRATRF